MKLLAAHGSEEFNRRLTDVLAGLSLDTLAGQGDNLIALILGGGYGRGEGGVVVTAGREEPFNDLDLVIVVRSKKAIDFHALAAVEAKYRDILGIHVDFARPLTVADIRAWLHWQVWHDLAAGHVVLHGPADILTVNAPAGLDAPLPLIEASRLLLNRGTGLMWSQRVIRGQEDEPDAGFVRRNFYKALLAMGDGLLIIHGRYTVPYTGRDRLVAELCRDSAEAAALDLAGRSFETAYAEALTFKFTPDRAPEFDLSDPALAGAVELWGRVFLQVENRRTGRNFADLTAYCRWTGIRERDQNTPARWPRNLVRNAQLGRLSPVYPRERLYRLLPGLLGLTGEAAGDWGRRTADYLAVWDRFN